MFLIHVQSILFFSSSNAKLDDIVFADLTAGNFFRDRGKLKSARSSGVVAITGMGESLVDLWRAVSTHLRISL